MKRLFLIILMAILSNCFLITCYANANNKLDTTTNLQQKVAKSSNLSVIYIEGGQVVDFDDLLSGLVHGLQNLKLISANNTLEDLASNKLKTAAAVWQSVAQNNDKNTLKFLQDGFYSANWNQKIRQQNIERIQERLDKRKDVDLILAFGTWAGQDVTKIKTDIPIIICAVGDPYGSGIIPYINTHKKTNMLCTVEPRFYQRQLEFYHKLINFKKLGITYEDTPAGRSMAALNEIQKKAKELGIKLVECVDAPQEADLQALFERRLYCNRLFASEQVDAVYITYDYDYMEKYQAELLDPLIKSRIITFAQCGVLNVKHGLLIGQSDTSNEEGVFLANLIKKISLKHDLQSIPYVFYRPLRLALNLNTASHIGWTPSILFILHIDTIFN